VEANVAEVVYCKLTKAGSATAMVLFAPANAITIPATPFDFMAT